MQNKLIIAFFCICISYIQAQTYDCGILKKSIELKAFQNHFIIWKTKEPLIIVDTNNYFSKTCVDLNVCNRKLSIDNKWPDGLSGRKYSSELSCDMLVLSIETVNNTTYTLNFWQPCSHAVLILEIKKVRKKLKIKVISEGVF